MFHGPGTRQAMGLTFALNNITTVGVPRNRNIDMADKTVNLEHSISVAIIAPRSCGISLSRGYNGHCFRYRG